MSERAAVRRILQGRGVFIGDIRDRDAYHVKVVRSAVCRGRIEAVAVPELPSEVRAITAADIPGRKTLAVFDVEVPVLADGQVRYKGEPVMLLAGPDEGELEELAERVVISYREEEPVLGFASPRPEQIVHRRTVTRGDADKAMASAARKAAGEFSTGLQEHYYPEPLGAHASWNAEASFLTVVSPSRWPSHVHRTLRDVLRLSDKALSVRSPADPDTSLDGKLWYPSLVAAHAGLAAILLGKSVKIMYSREEDFLYTPKRSPAVLRYAAGLDKEGRLLAADIEIVINTGAYPVFSRETVDRAAAAALGGYHCPNVRLSVLAAETNLPPLGPFSGAGSAMSLFAVEAFAERLRAEAGLDPAAWKKANLATPERGMLTGESQRAFLPEPALLDTALRMSDFSRKHAAFELARKRKKEGDGAPEALRGIGLAVGCQASGFFGAGEAGLGTAVKLSLDTAGKVRISCTAVPGGYALHRIWRRIAGESLGIPVEDVEIAAADTAGGPDSGPSAFSRNITIVTKLVEEACEQIKKKRFRSPLPLSVTKRHRPSRAAAWNDDDFTGGACSALSWAAAVVEVRVDPLTFLPDIRGIWLAVDAGTILDEREARRTIEVGINQAVGWALFERITHRRGEIPRDQFIGYRFPSSRDLPSPGIKFLEGIGKRPVKGIGELPLCCVPAAFACALGQAVGADITGIPVSPREDIPAPEARP